MCNTYFPGMSPLQGAENYRTMRHDDLVDMLASHGIDATTVARLITWSHIPGRRIGDLWQMTREEWQQLRDAVEGAKNKGDCLTRIEQAYLDRNEATENKAKEVAYVSLQEVF